MSWKQRFQQLSGVLGGLRKSYFFINKTRGPNKPLDNVEEAMAKLVARAKQP